MTTEVMLRYEETHPGSYYWFDPFSLNQHSETGVVETAVRPLLLALPLHPYYYKMW